MKTAALLVSAVMLSGCTIYYVKPNVSPQQVSGDLAYCRALGIGGPAGDIERLCMVGKGYTVTRQKPDAVIVY